MVASLWHGLSWSSWIHFEDGFRFETDFSSLSDPLHTWAPSAKTRCSRLPPCLSTLRCVLYSCRLKQRPGTPGRCLDSFPRQLNFWNPAHTKLSSFTTAQPRLNAVSWYWQLQLVENWNSDSEDSECWNVIIVKSTCEQTGQQIKMRMKKRQRWQVVINALAAPKAPILDVNKYVQKVASILWCYSLKFKFELPRLS